MSNTTFQEIKRRVMIGFPSTDGETIMAVEQAINDAIQAICMVRDFDEMIVTDEENAFTSANQQTYDWSDDWGLTRLKKIYSIRLIDGANSQKLIWVPPEEVDAKLPDRTTLSAARPMYYTQVGSQQYDLIAIPDDAYPLYIRYSQWPARITSDTTEVPFSNLDTILVFFSKDIANAYIGGSYIDFVQRATMYLSQGVKEDVRQPDQRRVAQPYGSSDQRSGGEYWTDPFVRRNP